LNLRDCGRKLHARYHFCCNFQPVTGLNWLPASFGCRDGVNILELGDSGAEPFAVT
jgi:hypothetical protein